MSGIMNCAIHGMQIPFHVCKHVYLSIKDGTENKMNYVAILNQYLCDDCNEKYIVNHLPSISIDEALELTENEENTIESKLIEVESVLDRKIICSKCYLHLFIEK